MIFSEFSLPFPISIASTKNQQEIYNKQKKLNNIQKGKGWFSPKILQAKKEGFLFNFCSQRRYSIRIYLIDLRIIIYLVRWIVRYKNIYHICVPFFPLLSVFYLKKLLGPQSYTKKNTQGDEDEF